jgi:multidrug resistance efflux pump
MDQYAVYSSVAGRVISIFKKEGSALGAGETILLLDNIQANANYSTASDALETAKNNERQLLDLKSQLLVQLEQFKLDSTNYMRQKRLWENEIGSYAQLEMKKLAFESSKNAVQVLNNKISVTAKQLSFNTIQAKNLVQLSEKSLNDFQVKSAISGTLYQLNTTVGDWISPVKPIAVIGNSNHYVLRLNIDEMDIAKIQINQTAVVSLDAYPGKAFKAHVSRIVPIMDPKTQSFTVEAMFDEVPEKLYPGLSAEVNIITNVKPNALLIPLSYLGKNNQVLTDQGEIKVKPGLKNMEWIEILSGLTANTLLIEPEKKK